MKITSKIGHVSSTSFNFVSSARSSYSHLELFLTRLAPTAFFRSHYTLTGKMAKWSKKVSRICNNPICPVPSCHVFEYICAITCMSVLKKLDFSH